MLDRRTLESCGYSLLAIVGGLALSFAPKLVFGPGPHPGASPVFVLTTTACMILAMIWTAGFSIAGFRRADEFIQARAQFAWYWGSTIGLVTMAPLFAFAMLGGLSWIAPGLDLSRHEWLVYAAGLMTPLVAQMLGFATATVWWRVNKR